MLTAGLGEPHRFLNLGNNFRTILPGNLKEHARVALVAWNVIAFEQDAIEGIIDPRRSVYCLMDGSSAGNPAPQFFVVSGGELYEYFHG